MQPSITKRPIDAAIAAAAVSLLWAASGFASTVDVRCPSVQEPQRAELSARARLLLSSAGMETASISIECDASGAWLRWTDGKRTRIESSSGVVEGALDAIENRIAQDKRARDAPPAPTETKPEAASPSSTETATSGGAPPNDTTVGGIEGGVGLSTLTEFWSGSAGVGIGPRLDVGVMIAPKFALVVSEGARFGVGPIEGQIMAFDLQVGVGFGAPYLARTGIGVVLFAGAERLAASKGGLSSEGLWVWSATGSLGLRGSLALGPVNGWAGVDAMVRSASLETGGLDPAIIPNASVLLSLGCFLPAFAAAEPTNARMVASRDVVPVR